MAASWGQVPGVPGNNSLSPTSEHPSPPLTHNSAASAAVLAMATIAGELPPKLENYAWLLPRFPVTPWVTCAEVGFC